jgi:hypothetical protein
VLGIVVRAPPVTDRDVQHNPDHDHRGQERRSCQQDPVVCHILDVRISQLRSHFRGFASHTVGVPRGGPCNHITFVQVHIASLALAPFSAGRDGLGVLAPRVPMRHEHGSKGNFKK